MSKTLEKFYEHLLGIEEPWVVRGIKRDSVSREVTIGNRYIIHIQDEKR